MNREETKSRIEVMQAYVDGKELEVRWNFEPDLEWIHIQKPVWDHERKEYRIRPEAIDD